MPFCLIGPANIPTAVPYDYVSMTTSGSNLYYLTSPATNTFTIARYNLSNGTTTLANALAGTPTTTVRSVGRIAVTPSGEAWIALTGYGNVRFQFGGAATRFDTTSNLAGVVMVEGETSATRVRYNFDPFGAGQQATNLPGVTTSSIGRADTFYRLSEEGEVSNLAQPAPPIVRTIEGTGGVYTAPFAVMAYVSRQDALWSATGGTGSRLVSGGSRYEEASPGVFLPVSDCTSAGYPLFDFRNDHVARICGGGASRLNYGRDLKSNELSILSVPGASFPANGAAFPGSLPPGFITSPTELVVDGRTNVFVASASRAEVERFDPTGGITSFLLTPAAPGTADYTSFMVRALRYNETLDSLVLVTRGPTGTTPRVWLVSNFR